MTFRPGQQAFLAGVLLVCSSLCVPAEERSAIRLTTAEYPPYEYQDSEQSEIQGFSAEVILAVFAQMQVSIKEQLSSPGSEH